MEKKSSQLTFEGMRRKREAALVFFLAVVFFCLVLVEIHILSISRQLPFVHSIFFFGLVNFNILILLSLLFFIFRNIVKSFVENEGRLFGKTLRAKLTAAFVTFSFVPTALMLIIAVFYIDNSFGKWFTERVSSVLRSALELNQEFIFTRKKENYHLANLAADRIRLGNIDVQEVLDQLRGDYLVDAIEYYPDVFGPPILSSREDDSMPPIPEVAASFLQHGLDAHVETSTIQPFAHGNMIRVLVPVSEGEGRRGAIIVSSFVPLALIDQMSEISTAFEEVRNLNPIQYPVRSIYMIILFLIALTILLCATWFGFYLARELSVPLKLLGDATHRVVQDDYRPLALESGSGEINQLVRNFNQMTETLSQSNKSLQETLGRLDKQRKYVEVVLSNVTTGVVSIDYSGLVTTINRHAGQLLGIDTERFLGKKLSYLLDRKNYHLYRQTLKNLRERSLTSVEREIQADIGGRSLSLQVHLSLLLDENGRDLGKVIVFDDLTTLKNAQRAAAWNEVARRIAHEIKNPLTPIKLSAQRLKKKFSGLIDDKAFVTSVEMIIKQTDDLKNLVNEFSQFGRLPQAKLLLSDMNQAVAETLAIYQMAHKEIEWIFDQDTELPKFYFDSEQIRRVLINLLDNAVAAVEKASEPRVTVRLQYDQMVQVLRLTVVDNGIGLPKGQSDVLFEPYFSTKDDGTGLGLSIVKRIIDDHKGFVRALTSEDGGAKILIELPVNPGEEPIIVKELDSE